MRAVLAASALTASLLPATSAGTAKVLPAGEAIDAIVGNTLREISNDSRHYLEAGGHLQVYDPGDEKPSVASWRRNGGKLCMTLLPGIEVCGIIILAVPTRTAAITLEDDKGVIGGYPILYELLPGNAAKP